MLLVCAAGCSAQQWQMGVGLGYGIYRNASIDSPFGKASAGIRNRFALSVVLGDDPYEHLGGEFRYLYQDGDPFLAAGGTQTNVQGQSHAFHYDVLVHLRRRDERIRPYFAAGVGAKYFVVTGPENPSAPLGEFGVLTTKSEVKPLVTGGGGLKIRVADHVMLRFDFLDYLTPFPKKVIHPAGFNTARGLLHQFTPLAGISYVF